MSDLVKSVTALALLAGLYYRYKNDALGCPVRVDEGIPRISYHLPIIGGLRVMLYSDIEDLLEILQSEFEANPDTDKLVMSMPSPAQPPYLVSINPKDVEHVLINNFDNYEKGDDFKFKTKELFGRGIFAADKEDWIYQRKVASKVFTTSKFKGIFETVFMQNVPRLLNLIEKTLQPTNTPSSLPPLPPDELVDMHDLFHRFFMDSFGKIAFGAELGSLDMKDLPFTAAFDRSQSILMARFLDPLYMARELFFPQIQRDFKTVRQFGLKVINDRRQGLVKGVDGDLISLFFKYKDDEGRSLNDDQMVDQVINFLIAGRDTTAQALSWTLYCLSKNPRCVEIMLDEINRVLDAGQDIPTYEQVKELKYTKAVFNETLRLYPSVAKDTKVAINDDVLPDGTKVAAGTLFVWFAYGMGRSERIWEDALLFKPERWLTGKVFSPAEYPAFNAGPRVCLGKTLAELQGVLVLATITKHYEFEIAYPDQIRPKSSLTLPMLNGLKAFFLPMSDLLAPVTALSVLAGLYYRYRDNAVGTSVMLDSSIPRPIVALPIIGSLRALFYDINDFNTNLEAEFKLQKAEHLVLSMPGQPPFLFTISAKDVEHILSKNFDNYVKGEEINNRMSVMFGKGIFAVDGKNWLFQRKVGAKVFTTKAFKNIFETVFMDNITTLRSLLAVKAGSMEQVDLHDIFHRFFMDSFGKIAFGLDLGSLSGKDVPFANAFDRSQSVLVYRFLSPFFKIEEFFKPQIEKDFKLVREFGLQVVRDRREGVVKGVEGDLISLFFKYKDDEGESLTDEQMVDQVINFLIAGRDTTAQALSWTMYCLSQHPECVDRILEEVNRIMEDGQEIPTYDQVKEMKYTKAVFQETLRLYPSVPKNTKMALNDDVLPDGTKVPAGTLIGWFPYGMGRNERIWGDDASQFKPDRWLQGETYSQYEYPAFNAGPRICLGKTLAELQGVLVLSTITKHFKFQLLDPSHIKQKISLTLPLLNGLKLNVAARDFE